MPVDCLDEMLIAATGQLRAILSDGDRSEAWMQRVEQWVQGVADLLAAMAEERRTKTIRDVAVFVVGLEHDVLGSQSSPEAVDRFCVFLGMRVGRVREQAGA